MLSPEQLAEIERLAREADPDAWCDDACELAQMYLREQGINAQLEADYNDAGGFRGMTHSWLRLPDGSIVDPTVSQFPGAQWPSHPAAPSVAVIPSEHPMASDYVDPRRRQSSQQQMLSAIERYAKDL